MSNTSRPRSKPPRRRSLPGPNIPRSPFLPAAPCPLARPFATRYSPLATHHSPHSRSSASGDAQDRPGPPKTTSYPPCISVPRPRRTGYAHPRPAIQNKGLQPHHPPPPIAPSPSRPHPAEAGPQFCATPRDGDALLRGSRIGTHGAITAKAGDRLQAALERRGEPAERRERIAERPAKPQAAGEGAVRDDGLAHDPPRPACLAAWGRGQSRERAAGAPPAGY